MGLMDRMAGPRHAPSRREQRAEEARMQREYEQQHGQQHIPQLGGGSSRHYQPQYGHSQHPPQQQYSGHRGSRESISPRSPRSPSSGRWGEKSGRSLRGSRSYKDERQYQQQDYYGPPSHNQAPPPMQQHQGQQSLAHGPPSQYYDQQYQQPPPQQMQQQPSVKESKGFFKSMFARSSKSTNPVQDMRPPPLVMPHEQNGQQHVSGQPGNGPKEGSSNGGGGGGGGGGTAAETQDMQRRIGAMEVQLQELDELKKKLLTEQRSAVEWREKWNFQNVKLHVMVDMMVLKVMEEEERRG